MTARHTDRPALAIALMTLAMFAGVGMNATVKVIGPEYHPFQATFLRNLFATFLVIPFVLRDGGLEALKTKRPGLQVLRAVCGIVGASCFFYAVQFLPVAEVTVISQATPLVVAALAIPILGETVGWRRWSAILIGFIGVVIALGPAGSLGWASLVVVFGTLLWSVTILTQRELGKTDSPAATTFYYMVIGTVLAGMVQPWVWKAPTTDAWILFAVTAVFGAAAILLIAYALRIGEASVVAPFHYSAIVWGIAADSSSGTCFRQSGPSAARPSSRYPVSIFSAVKPW